MLVLAPSLTQNWTLAIEANGATAVAVAEMLCVELIGIVVALPGAVSVTVGGFGKVPPKTVTTEVKERVLAPRLSVATAVMAWLPIIIGVQDTLKGALAEVPRLTPLAKNWTLETVPSISVAVAEIGVGVPNKAVEATLRLTVGAWFAATVTFTVALVVRLPKVSVAITVKA